MMGQAARVVDVEAHPFRAGRSRPGRRGHRGGRGDQGEADLPDQCRLLERAGSVHGRCRRRARRPGGHGHRCRKCGRQGRRRAGRRPGDPDPFGSLCFAGGPPAARLSPTSTSTPATRAARTWPPDATIPQDHTAVPVSTDELLKELQRTLNALNPHAVGDLVTNLATDLDGQGANLNKLIASAAGTVQLLADEGGRPRPAQRHPGPAHRHARHRHQPDRAARRAVRHGVDHCGPALRPAQRRHHPAGGSELGLVSLLVPNLQPLEADVGTVTTVGRTLDRNLSSVDEILQNGNNLFQGAGARLRPELQLARPEPRRVPRRHRRLHRGAPPRPVGRHLPAHRGQPFQRALRGRAGHLEPVRQPVVGLLRSAAQRHPDHLEQLEWRERVRHRPVHAAAGSGPDRQRRARRARRHRPHRRRRLPRARRRRPPRPPRRHPRRPRPRQPRAVFSAPSSAARVPVRVPARSGGSSSSGSGLGGLLSNQATRRSSASTATLAVAKPDADRARRLSAARRCPRTRSTTRSTHRGLLSRWVHDVEGWF